jgi:hypothetical protein
MAIDNPLVREFLDADLRPLAELIRAVELRSAAVASRWFDAGINTLVPNTSEDVVTGRPNLPTLTGAQVTGAQVTGGQVAGARAAQRLAGREEARATRGADNARGERIETWVLTQGELDRASGRLKHLAMSAVWLREVAAEHAQLSHVSRKTMRLDRLAE